jgi:serine/threonine-protein kinase
VEALDAGSCDGQGWVAMELVPGVSMARYMQDLRLQPPRVVAVTGLRLALAPAHAHLRGVVRRDVKPANTGVDWARDDLKLIDFGVAHWAGPARTRTGQILGSPGCMAPEQLAGRRPHSAPTPGGLLGAVAREPAPELAALRSKLPAASCQVVMNLLAKAAAHRAADAQAVADRLAAHAGDVQVGRP